MKHRDGKMSVDALGINMCNSKQTSRAVSYLWNAAFGLFWFWAWRSFVKYFYRRKNWVFHLVD